MRSLAAIVVILALCVSIVAMGCKSGKPSAEDAAKAPDDIKAKMKAGGCAKLMEPASKEGKGMPAAQPAKDKGE